MKEVLKPFSKDSEEEVRKFWETEKIKEKVRAKSNTAKKTFYFMDGPPYATGHIHMGTALNKIMKDCAIRSQRMQGKKVFDRPGFDTHGLPIENKVEKKLGFENKEDIEKYGVEKFIKECNSFATEFVDTMAKEFDNLGDWMPYSDPYLTLTNDFIEGIWYAFKKADEKDLLYLGKYPVHVCPHCATAVAFNEIEYNKTTDSAIFVKLKLVDEENTFLVIWTTTPWTLPANTGVMIHPTFEYAFVKMSNGEKWIIAKEKVDELMNVIEAGYLIEKVVVGKELEGKKYVPLYDGVVLDEEKQNAFRVILNDRYVNLSDGSGLVHTAPGHGKEDFDAGTKAGLPVVSPVNIDGTFTKEVSKYSGKKVKEVNEKIIEELNERGLLVYKHSYTHDYPFCWRCDSPLLMISVPQWFLKVSEIRQQMIDSNENVNWVPAWMKDRMRNWLENLSDWPVSRARYWGTPLPIWVCECGERKVIGSVEELKKEGNLKEEIELHKPFIDKVKMKCSCGKEMSRVSEVLDVWFDSGVTSWANLGFPQNKELFDEFWPADLNIEMTEQVRGWWNAQSILSTICFDKLPYKSISVHGMVRDLGHKKMSKSRGNAISPEEMIEKYNRDYLRSYLLLQSRGTDFKFDVNGVGEMHSFFNTLNNSLNYVNMYSALNFSEGELVDLMPEDKLILSKLATLSENVLAAFNSYEFYKSVSLIMEFVDKDFSRTYLQLIRKRIGDKQVSQTISIVVDSLLRLFAPIAPHATDYYYTFFNKDQSVHLLNFKDVSKFLNKELENEFLLTEEISKVALSVRSAEKLRLRWVLDEMVIESKIKLNYFEDVLKTMVNVNKINLTEKFNSSNDYAVKEFSAGKIYLKTSASKELKNAWELSELLRQVQDARKKAGLKPGQKVELLINSNDLKFIEENKSVIETKTTTTIKIVDNAPTQKMVEREFFIELNK